MSVEILATGSYIPEREIPNSAFTQFPPKFLPLIESKTGVRARHYAAENEFTSDLAARAAGDCLKAANMFPGDLDAIILATSSPDRIQPATATRVQALLEAHEAFAFDINSVCSGALFALETANSMIRSGLVSNAIVVAAEIYSRFLNPSDFSTAPYFGDGAGAVLLRRSNRSSAILGSVLRTDGRGDNMIQVPAGGTMLPYAAMTEPRQQFFAMSGKKVFDFAVTKGSEIICDLLELCGMTTDDVSWVVPHQANLNIVAGIAQRTGIPRERFRTTLERYGNTAAASVLITYDELRRSGEARPGQLVVLVTFGGGLSWAATAVKM